jgi:hypothetical protein
MAIRGKWSNGILIFFEATTHETVLPVAPILFQDDFVSAVDARWTAKDTGAATEALVADTANGVLGLALDATNEKQEAGYYFNNERNFALNLGPVFECRAALHVLPTGQSEIYFGLAGDYVEGPIAEADAGPAEHIFFCFDGSGACKIFTDDTSTDNDAVATGVTVVADAYHIFKIDCSDPTSVKFYIDGAQVAASTTFTVNAVAALALQPFLICHKETGTGLGNIYVDYVRCWQKRS